MCWGDTHECAWVRARGDEDASGCVGVCGLNGMCGHVWRGVVCERVVWQSVAPIGGGQVGMTW